MERANAKMDDYLEEKAKEDEGKESEEWVQEGQEEAEMERGNGTDVPDDKNVEDDEDMTLQEF